MASLPEKPEYEEGIYQIEMADPVLGGVDGISNRQARQLANRTGWLRQAFDQLSKGMLVAGKAARLATARSFTFKGAATGQASFDGSTDIAIDLTLADSGARAGSYPVITINSKGLALSGRALQADEIPDLPWGKIVTGKPTTLAGYGITDALPASSFNWNNLPGKPVAFPVAAHSHDWDSLTGKPATLAGYRITTASQSEAEAGTNNDKPMTPARVAQAIDKRLVPATEQIVGLCRLATQDDLAAGQDSVVVTPKRLRAGFSALLSDTGYIALPSWLGGLILQWGIGPAAASQMDTYLTFPLAFPTKVFCFMPVHGYTSGSGSIGYINGNPIGLTHGVARSSTNGLGFFWIAIGK